MRAAVLVAAAVSDVLDGAWARARGGSRIGAWLDPVADKLFMAAAFWVVLGSGVLTPLEVIGVLARDLIAAVAFFGTLLLGRPIALPARAGGKAVTLCQVLVLVAFLAGSELVRPLAWATAAISMYAVWDYSRTAFVRPIH